MNDPVALWTIGILLTLCGGLAGFIATLFLRGLDRRDAKTDKQDDAAIDWASRLSSLETQMEHVSTDREDHRAQSATLSELQATVARIDERTLAMRELPRQMAEIMAYALKTAITELRAAA